MKKGFTLVELIAVIIVLAIVALLATPKVIDVISDSRESANLRSIEGYARAIKQEYYNQSMDGGTPTIDGTFLSNVETGGGNIVCEDILYNPDNGVIMNKCKFDNNDKEYCYANDNHYACDDEVFLGIYNDQNVPQSKSFAEDSWETISAVVKAGKAEEYYNVGDTKEVTLTGDYSGTYTVRIANISTPEECSIEGFSQTACGFVVEFVDIITEHAMNSPTEEYEYGTNEGGWPASQIHSLVNIDIYNILPSDLQNVIIDTYSVSGHGDQSGATNFTSIDKLYLLSSKEVWGKDGTDNIIDGDSAEDETRQLDYYKNNSVTTDSYSGAVKTYQGNANIWWLRTAYSYNSEYFIYVIDSGDVGGRAAMLPFGVAPAFRIG